MKEKNRVTWGTVRGHMQKLPPPIMAEETREAFIFSQGGPLTSSCRREGFKQVWRPLLLRSVK